MCFLLLTWWIINYPQAQTIPAGLPTPCLHLQLQDCYANTLAPINRLPLELLHMVFKEAARMPKVVQHFDWRCVLVLTHVCRLWRTMVVAESLLWSHIHMQAGTRCVELFIQRSSGLPLTLHTFLNLNEVGLLDDVLCLHAARARAVHIDHQGIDQYEWVPLSIVSRYAWSLPQVECFVLNAAHELWQDEPVHWHIVTETVSPLKALRLHLISLWECLPTTLFPNLTHLLLESASSDFYSADLLLRLLSRTPLLQHLQLVTANLARVDPECDRAFSAISLPHIRTVSVHATELDLALFLLRHLDLPEECAVCVNGRSSLDSTSLPSVCSTR